MTKKRRDSVIYANVIMRDDHRLYSSFFHKDKLDSMIAAAIRYNHGVIAIERAHAGEPPVWTRGEDQ